MPQNLRAIRRKVRTVQSIAKITRAMKMVAAASLRRVQGLVENGRAYWDALDQLLAYVAAQEGEFTHPFLEESEAEPVAVLVIAGSRGLCGSYNVSVLRHAEETIKRITRPVRLMTVGPKAELYFAARGPKIFRRFEMPDDKNRLSESLAISSLLREQFLAGEVGQVQVISTEFYSAIRHYPADRRLLPIQPLKVEEENGDGVGSCIFEPPAEQLLSTLLPRSIDAVVYRLLLESAAAEAGARMAAMTAATDNADEMVTTLNRDLNRARQTQITTEILEVITGANALMSS